MPYKVVPQATATTRLEIPFLLVCVDSFLLPFDGVAGGGVYIDTGGRIMSRFVGLSKSTALGDIVAVPVPLLGPYGILVEAGECKVSFIMGVSKLILNLTSSLDMSHDDASSS